VSLTKSTPVFRAIRASHNRRMGDANRTYLHPTHLVSVFFPFIVFLRFRFLLLYVTSPLTTRKMRSRSSATAITASDESRNRLAFHRQ
jgi:hypothetical protein